MKAKLEALKEGDSNLYQHLVSVLRQIILSNDREGFQLFEHYSQQIKANHQLSPTDHHQYAQSLA